MATLCESFFRCVLCGCLFLLVVGVVGLFGANDKEGIHIYRPFFRDFFVCVHFQHSSTVHSFMTDVD